MIKQILGCLLFQANSRPLWKQQFYEVKKIVLEKHGTFIGYEVQHLEEQECFACEGSGREFDWEENDYVERCYRCGGTGIYNTEKWIGLKKYQFGKYSFHIPISTLEEKHCEESKYHNPESIKVIEGIIKHQPQKHYKLAFYVLMLFYNPRFFLRFIPKIKSEKVVKPIIDDELPF